MVFRAAASLLILVVALLSFAGLDPLRPSSTHRQLGPAVARAGTDNQDNAAADNQDNLASDNQGSSSDLDNLLAELDNLGVTIIIGGGGSGVGSGSGSGTITTDNGSATLDNGNVTIDEDGGDNGEDGEDNGDNLDNFDFDDDDDGGQVVVDLRLPELGAVPSTVAAAQVVSACAPAGRETVLTSTDQSIAVRLTPTPPQDVRLTLRPELTLAPVPPTPGLRIGGIVFELLAEGCGGGSLAELPAPANLSVRYTELDVSGLTEQRLVLARLEPSTNFWEPAPAQLLDPANNTTSATITRPGYYTLYYELF